MSTNPKITEIEVAPDEARAEGRPAVSTAGGFKMFNRVLDWITSDRMQLINITDRINEIVRKTVVAPHVPDFGAQWAPMTWDFDRWHRDTPSKRRE